MTSLPTPLPHQTTGALFLAARKAALLADEPRVGKTGAAVMACDFVFARRILVITTASGRPNWGRDFREWSAYPRDVQVIYTGAERPRADVVIIGWPAMKKGPLLEALATQPWDAVIPDESHYAMTPEAKRTRALYEGLRSGSPNAYWWCLTGTPAPNAPHNLFPMLHALAPERIEPYPTYESFIRRFCTTKPRWIGGRKIDVVTGGRNLEELRDRLDGFWLRRTQQDVGIGEPRFSTFLVHADRLPPEFRQDFDTDAILAAAEVGDTAALEMHLGTIRRITGQIVARLVVDAIAEELDGGLDRIVLMAWHTDVVDTLAEGLTAYGVVTLDGRAPPGKRKQAEDDFRAGRARVFVGQIKAAGENIDLSAACNLMFVELSFVPADMKQASLRITNIGQTRQCLVRVCALEGSIYEALARVVIKKVQTLRKIMEK